jgi:outer membrane protein assembly factor BamB
VVLLATALALAPLLLTGSARASSVDQGVAYQADAAHDGHVTQAHLTTPLSKLWSVEPGGRMSYPLIVNGVIYVTVSGNGETKLDAIDAATGKTLWSAPSGAEGAAYDEGRIFTGVSRGAIAGHNELIAYDAASGNVDWAREPEVFWFTSPPTAAGGVLFFSAYDGLGALFAVRESDGKEIWSRNRGNGNESGLGGDSSPAIANGNLYVDYECQQDFAFDALSGDQVWHHNGHYSCGGGSTPVVAEGLVYDRGRFYGTPSGLLLSAFEGVEEGLFNGSGEAPAVAAGTAYFPEGKKLVAASDAGLGVDLWTFEAGSKLTTAPLVAGNLVLVASESGELYALNASGEVAWSGNAGVPIPGPEPPIVRPPGGMAAGEGLLVVPAGETLVAYTPTSALSGVPAAEVAPHIEGVVRAERQVAADVGVWTGVPASYSYQWLSCNSLGEDCSDIEGATSPTYTPGEAAVFGTLKVKVTATNTEGSASALSEPSSPVVAREPTSLTRPTITGNAWVGYTLSASPGTWSGAPTTFEYQWSRCETGECSPIPGAVRSTYTPTEEDQSYQLEVAVTPVDGGGPSPPARSSWTAHVTLPEAPGNYHPPTITGTPEYPGTLTASTGSWSENPTSFEYQWFACEARDLCSPIRGATASTYELTPFDVGERIEVGVTARNAAGPSEQAFSAQMAAVTTLAPENVSPPSLEGSLIVGAQLTANVGHWDGSPTGYEYVWLRCEQKAELCAPIEGASEPTYKLAAADKGQLIAVAVVAHNAHGYSVPVISEAEGPVHIAPIEVITTTTTTVTATRTTTPPTSTSSTSGVTSSTGSKGSIGHAGGPGRGGAARARGAAGGEGVSVPLSCEGPTDSSCALTAQLNLPAAIGHGKVVAVSSRTYAHESRGTSKANRQRGKPLTRQRTLVIGRLSVTLAAGQREIVTVGLDARGRRLLAQRHSLQVALIVSQRSSGGKPQIVEAERVTLRAGGSKRHASRARKSAAVHRSGTSPDTLVSLRRLTLPDLIDSL